tara:strand:+ start:6194 stop:6565 length:372 start_codon:yes stop_codon:yes gene_type:complete
MEEKTYFLAQKDALYQLWDRIQKLLASADPVTAISIKSYSSVTADYTIVASDYLINATVVGITVTLPTAVGADGRLYVVKNTSGGNVSLDADGTETIDGNLTVVLYNLEAYTVMSDGTNWIIV